MKVPERCPVCGRDSIRPVSGTVLFHPEEDSNSPDEFSIAYWCEAGHMFLLEDDGPDASNKGA